MEARFRHIAAGRGAVPAPPQRSLCVRPTRGARAGGGARRQARAGNSKGTGTDDLGRLARPGEAAGEPLTAPRSIIRDRFCFRAALGRTTPRDAAKPAAGSLGQEPEHTLLLAATRANGPRRAATAASSSSSRHLQVTAPACPESLSIHAPALARHLGSAQRSGRISLYRAC